MMSVDARMPDGMRASNALTGDTVMRQEQEENR